MKQVKELKLVFENVTESEKLTVSDSEESDVGYLFISDIEKRVIMTSPGIAEENYIFRTLSLKLNPSANKHFDEYGNKSDKKLFERITDCNDITDIILYFDDGTSEDYCPYWHEDDDDINRYQESKVSDGILEIRLSAPKQN